MSTNAPRRVSDGYFELSAGVDSGKTPNLIPKNCAAWATNTTFRGGWPTCRPGYRKIELDFGGDEALEEAFKNALFQVGDGYVADSGAGSLISMHGGRVFRVNITNSTFPVQEISISGDYNPDNRERAWSVQAENYFIIQDGQSKPFIFNGASAVRATETQIPVGKQMTYYMGRIWVANGRQYLAGDIVFGPSGSAGLGFRDSILYMTENAYLAGGGSFAVPVSAGEITALVPIANVNTALGQGDLIVFTESAVFATLVPQDRVQWQNTTQPLQRMIQLANGAYSQAGVTNVNEDLFYRSSDGIRSLAFSVRNAGQWGNTPISNEVIRALSRDPDGFLKFCSAVNFDNRLLCTTSPGYRHGRGVYHRALVVLDFDLITGMLSKAPPAWEGVWTGLSILKVVTVVHNTVPRCFAYVLNGEHEIELWEITKDDHFDYDGSEKRRIVWSQESRSMDFGSKFDAKKLFAGDLFFDELNGQVNFDIDFRPDSYPCWIDWDSWEECAKTQFCADDFGTCPTLPNWKEQYRPKRQLVQPPDTMDPILNSMYRIGYEFQVRLTITGKARSKQLRINCQDVSEKPFGKQL